MYRAGIPNTSGKESKRGRLRRLKLSLPDVCGSCFIHDLVFLAAMSDIEEEYEDQAEEGNDAQDLFQSVDQKHQSLCAICVFPCQRWKRRRRRRNMNSSMRKRKRSNRSMRMKQRRNVPNQSRSAF
ncbi:uncharacterized protein LOC109509393 isoform X1 [Hippocampus comes]|uniref:uncharacterized protein LOC109509393 isoform X1 n=1 Tax=Hippocampus comes TaxID=109280 RepID=UPI00094E72DB|nr:PREDICTED: uncharacterized protein LOC109509393 isoform X1 [Hippocampus comes]